MTWDRKQMMRDVVAWFARIGILAPEKAPAIANTYGVPVACVDAEMMKHMQEGDGK